MVGIVHSLFADVVTSARDECSSNPCQNGARCTDALNYYLCSCQNDNTGRNCERGMLIDSFS